MAAAPPDILLTTTEMLNQRLSDNHLNRLFGIGAHAARPPELVLLDEVHTYEGRHGAQVAYLLRRWQHLVEQRFRFVGLSATLREAETFFSALQALARHWWRKLRREATNSKPKVRSTCLHFVEIRCRDRRYSRPRSRPACCCGDVLTQRLQIWRSPSVAAHLDNAPSCLRTIST